MDLRRQKEKAEQLALLMTEKFDRIVATHIAIICEKEHLNPLDLCLCHQTGSDGTVRWWFEKKPPITLDK